MNPFPDWPTPEEERLLLSQLNTGTPTAREELAVRYLPLLMRFLDRVFPQIAAELRDTAADEALIIFLSHPDRFHPERATLGAYLRMAARRDLLNLFEQENRTRRGIPLDSVVEPADHRNKTRDEELSWDHPRLAAEVATLNVQERIVFELMRDGIRDTASFVNGLGLHELGKDKQPRAVKRSKDRLKQRFIRAVRDLQ